MKSKKAMEFKYLIAILIMLVLFIFVLIWYGGLRESALGIINSFFN